MKIGQVVGVLAVGGYLAFELTALARARPRMEPDAIYGSMVEAQVAVRICGDAPGEQIADFESELERMRARVEEKLAETATSEPVGARITAITREAEKEAEAMVDAEGCDSFEVRRLLQRHKMHARRAG